uniref:F-box domain-containing protein n=1 Tax=Steinernema glaseri TaxID=37863 RepID=A0A1I7ZFE0_9BILA
MDSVPDVFVEALCAHLTWRDLETLESTSSSWTTKADIHFSKRRELTVVLHANDEGIQVTTLLYEEGVPFIIDPRYDQIERIYLLPFEDDSPPGKMVSPKHFTNKILPVLSSLVVHCQLDIFESLNQNVTDSVFNAFYSCVQLKKISTANYGKKCTEFIEHQIGLGHLTGLRLKGDGWPAQIISSIRSFLNSPILSKLDLRYSNLTLDFDMVTGFVGRFLDGDRPKRTCLCGPISFPLEDLRSFRPESIEDCSSSNGVNKNVAWALRTDPVFISMEIKDLYPFTKNSPTYISVCYATIY